MSGVGLAALGAICAALVMPAGSLAGTVSVEELQGEPRQAKVSFAAGAGEANDLTVTVAGEEGLFYDLQLVDAAGSIEPGPGCDGGGAAGVAVHCKVHKPTPGDNIVCFKGCQYEPGTKWELGLTFRLGDGGSRLDTTALPASARDPQQLWTSPLITVTVTPGAGDDTVLTGAGPDRIGPSPGADLIRTGDGIDAFEGGALPDGPDDVLLGADSDTIDYSERTGGVHYDPNGLADDGGAREGDNLDLVEVVETGAGDDTLAGPAPPSDASLLLVGGPGDDTIRGGDGDDTIRGGAGDDRLFGGSGDDQLLDPLYAALDGESGNDIGVGGEGGDEIALGSGDDRAVGDAGDDRIALDAGSDRATGDAGRDLIQLGPGPDHGAGGTGDDLLLAGQGSDVIRGQQGDDRLSGDAGGDSVFGGEGDDRIAAGMVAVGVFDAPLFLRSLGPLERSPDRVDCGAGRDAVKVGPEDSASSCESTPSAKLIELLGIEQEPGDPRPSLHIVVRGGGIVTIAGKGLEPKQFGSAGYAGWRAPLLAQGRALGALRRDGHVELRARISLRALDGHEFARFRTVDIWLPVGLSARDPA